MNRLQFLNLPSVNKFINWLAVDLDTIKVDLNIKSSKFVLGGIRAKCIGVDAVLGNYRWKSTGMLIGDWNETRNHLNTLANNLRVAVNTKSESNTLIACREIIEWGGDRNHNVGATPFLKSLANNGTLCDYIRNSGSAFSLATANEATLSPPVLRMNAMLTKVHALYATDGLPIYDSRVAAAIASLVERWRFSTNQTVVPLPQELLFRATVSSRTAIHKYPNAHNPGVMSSVPQINTKQWSSAKVRLGWVMEEVLNQTEILSSCSSLPILTDRMHAFEASLFMIGYDVCCII